MLGEVSPWHLPDAIKRASSRKCQCWGHVASPVLLQPTPSSKRALSSALGVSVPLSSHGTHSFPGGRWQAEPFLRARPMCCGTPSCAAPSAPSWPFVCSSEHSLGVTRALPLGRRAGTRCLIEPRSQPQPGTRLWERSFLQRYSAWGCLDLFCRAPRTKRAAARAPCV